MMLDKVIEPESLRAVAGGATVGLRLPWYRTLPLSTIDVDQVKIDGEPIDAERMTLAVNGGEWPLSALRGQTDQNWFVIDTATLHIDGADLTPGSTHDIEVTVSLYPPYIKGLRRAVRWSRQMEVR